MNIVRFSIKLTQFSKDKQLQQMFHMTSILSNYDVAAFSEISDNGFTGVNVYVSDFPPNVGFQLF